MGSAIKDEDDKVRREIKKEIMEYNKKDTVNIVLKSTLGSIPVVGAAISELIDVVIPQSSFERLLDFAIEVSKKLESLSSKVDIQFIKSEEVGHIFRDVVLSVIQNYESEKINAFKGILLNSLINKDIEFEVKEVYLNLSKNLTGLHLGLLSLLDDPDNFAKMHSVKPTGGNIIGNLQDCFPNLSQDIILLLWRDLYNYGLVNTTVDSLGGGTSSQGIDSLRGRLSESGKRFVSFIKSPS
jgi:hypothetical protein